MTIDMYFRESICRRKIDGKKMIIEGEMVSVRLWVSGGNRESRGPIVRRTVGFTIRALKSLRAASCARRRGFSTAEDPRSEQNRARHAHAAFERTRHTSEYEVLPISDRGPRRGPYALREREREEGERSR